MNQRFAKIDFGIFISSIALMGFGIVLVYSSSFALAQDRYGGADYFLARHLVRALLAIVCFVVFINIDYHVWGRYANIGFIAAIALLVLVLLMPESGAIKGARRWFSLGPLRFQVSELARMALIIVLARKFEELGPALRSWEHLLPQLAKIGIVSGLILLEPNFSTAAIVGIVGVSLLYVAGARIVHLLSVAALLLPAAIAAMLSAPYRVRRLIAFLHMSNHKDDTGYQSFQALVGLGNGGIFGRGLGQGEQKFFYLPEPHTDFIFSILGEEIGFFGLLLVLALFCFLIYCGIKVALRASDRMGQIMAFGFTFMLAIYIVLHASVNTGLLPTTGLPLPFLSYGGMSLIFTMAGMGIMLNISSQAGAEKTGAPARGADNLPLAERSGRTQLHARQAFSR